VTLPLPQEQWAKLLGLQAPPAIGDIWLVPKEYVRFPGGKPRRCLVVWLEPPGAPVRVHLIAGTSSYGPPPARVLAEPDDDNGLELKTYFKFQDPVEEFDLLELQTVAERIGRVSAALRNEIAPAIAASQLAALKQLVNANREES
jgi:hypothetical protein